MASLTGGKLLFDGQSESDRNLEITRVKIKDRVNTTKDYFIKAIRVSKGGQPEFTPNLILKFNEETANHEIYIMQGQNLVFRGDYFPDGSLQNGVLDYEDDFKTHIN